MANNGSGWIKWAIGLIIVVLVAVLPVVSNVIWSNDKDSRAREEGLRKEAKTDLEKVCFEFKGEFKELKQAQTDMMINQNKMAVVLERIDRKVR